MATGKRYFWIKLKDTFFTSDTVDFLMQQQNGAEYVVLYQMLCMKTANTNGRMERKLGEVIIPYDEAKIQRDCKFFSIDTVRVALSLYRKLGLVYEDKNGTLVIANHNEMVGSETDYANQKRNQRLQGVDNVHLLSTPMSTECPENVHKNVHTDIEKEKEKEKEKDSSIISDDERPDFNTIEVYATSNLEYMSAGNMEQLVSFLDDLPENVIRYAIDCACANGKRKWSYVSKILQNWLEAGVRTLGDAKAKTESWSKEKKAKEQSDSGGGSPWVF